MSLDCLIAALSIVLIIVIGRPAQDKQAPTFRTQIDAVSVDVSVLDKHRHPIVGLGADDFTILVDGHARPIVAFAAVDALASKRRVTQFPSSPSVATVDPSRVSISGAA